MTDADNTRTTRQERVQILVIEAWEYKNKFVDPQWTT